MNNVWFFVTYAFCFATGVVYSELVIVPRIQ